MLASSIQAEMNNPYGKVRKPEKIYFFLMEKNAGQMCIYIVFLMCLGNGAALIIIV